MRVYESEVGALARLHKALGDETRLRIVHLLAARGELCVCDVETILAVSQSKASRHLNHLKQVGLVEDRREGTWVHYRLARSAAPTARAAVRALRRALTGDPLALADLENADTCARSADCTPRATRTQRGRR